MSKRPWQVGIGLLLAFSGGMAGEAMERLHHCAPTIITEFAQQRREFGPPEHYELDRMVERPAESVAVMIGGITVTAQAGLSTGVGASVTNRLMRACVRCGARFEVARSEAVCSNCARGA